MNQAVVFSSRVLATLNSLPDDERSTIAAALTGEFLLGVDGVTDGMTGIQQIVYRIIRSYVVMDMKRTRSSVTA